MKYKNTNDILANWDSLTDDEKKEAYTEIKVALEAVATAFRDTSSKL